MVRISLIISLIAISLGLFAIFWVKEANEMPLLNRKEVINISSDNSSSDMAARELSRLRDDLEDILGEYQAENFKMPDIKL